MMSRRAVLAMSSTAAAGIALAAIAWLAARRLTTVELGFFFSFLSFGALIQLCDFGLSYSALQTAGHLVGSGRLGELPALAARVSRWNLATVCTASLAVFVAGWATFSATGAAGWQRPWMAYVLAVLMHQLTMPRMSLREGSGKVAQVWTVRLVYECIAGFACLTALHFGAGLWSLAVFSATRAAVSAAWLIANRLRVNDGEPVFSMERWMAEIWPFQWRMGVSGLSGFLIFRAFALIVMSEQGPIAAGEIGLASSLMNLLITVSTAWPLSQAARYAALNAGGGTDELRHEFPKMLWASTALAAVAAVGSSLVLWRAREMGIAVALRLPDAWTTAIVLCTAVIHHFVSCFAVFLRSQGREPLLWASVLGSIATGLAVWLAAHYGTLRDVAIANLILVSIGIPIVLSLFRPRWKLLAK